MRLLPRYEMAWTLGNYSEESATAFILYRHPRFALIPYKRLPVVAFRAIGPEGYALNVNMGTALVMLRDDKLYFVGPRSIWARWAGTGFRPSSTGTDQVLTRPSSHDLSQPANRVAEIRVKIGHNFGLRLFDSERQ